MTTQAAQQDGTRKPAAAVPPAAWEEMEATIQHAGHQHPVQGRPQTGERTPSSGVYEELAEPPEVPPILINPPRPPKPAKPYEARTPDVPHGDEGHGDHTVPERVAPDPGLHAGHPTGHPSSETTLVVRAVAAPRQNQRNLTSAARAELHRRLRDYLASPEDPVTYHRENGHVHGTPQFLPWHRQFIDRFERWQRTRLADSAAFIPLAFWDPADPIPSEFPYPGRNPNLGPTPAPASLAPARLGGLDFAQFQSILEAYHNHVHDSIGGDMRNPIVSPRDTCFWLLHSYIDNLFAQWEVMRSGSNT